MRQSVGTLPVFAGKLEKLRKNVECGDTSDLLGWRWTVEPEASAAMA